MSDAFKVVTVSLRHDSAIQLRVPADVTDETVTAAVEQKWRDASNHDDTRRRDSDHAAIVKDDCVVYDAVVVDSEAINLSAREARQVKSFWIVAQANLGVAGLEVDAHLRLRQPQVQT